jgi:DNA-binding response OmpR family regulator
MNIVLIENDVALLRTLEILLKKQGNEVRIFDDPVQACSFLERSPQLDILIIDYMMPNLTAPEVIERVKKHFPKGARIILISGHTDIIETLDLQEMGVDAFLAKPLDLDLLFDLLYAEQRKRLHQMHDHSPISRDTR